MRMNQFIFNYAIFIIDIPLLIEHRAKIEALSQLYK